MAMSTTLVRFPYPAKKDSFNFLWNFVPGVGTAPNSVGGGGGGGGWWAVTPKGRWLCPVRRQMAVDWPALWQYCAQKPRTKRTLSMWQVWDP